MILIPIFIVLFAAWMLWGWCVGESRNIKWLRLWCAPTFVVIHGFICMGIGAGAGWLATRTVIQRDVEELLQNVEVRVESGEGKYVVEEIHDTFPENDPDQGVFSVLDLLPTLNDRLSKSSTTIAEKPDSDIATLPNNGTQKR